MAEKKKNLHIIKPPISLVPGDMAFNPNPFYQGHTLKDLLDPNLSYWVHHGRYILKQGRTIWWNPNVGTVT